MAGMRIPGWFTTLCGGTIGIMVPWAAWMTLSIATISAHWEAQVETNSRVIQNLEALAGMRQDVSHLEKRLTRIEEFHLGPDRTAGSEID